MNELSARLNRLAPSATLAMSQKSSELKAQGVDVINLSVGEPDFNTPENIKKAAIKAVNDNFSHYSPVPGYPVLREAIAGKLKRENGLEYATSQILCSNGAKQSVCNVIMSIIQAGDEVIIPAPYWVSYPQMVKLAEGDPVCVSAGIEQDFKITPAQLEAAITPHTRALIICSPSNPTGSIYSRAELEALAEVLKKHERIIVLSDEIYEHINYVGEHASMAQVDGMKERTVIINDRLENWFHSRTGVDSKGMQQAAGTIHKRPVLGKPDCGSRSLCRRPDMRRANAPGIRKAQGPYCRTHERHSANATATRLSTTTTTWRSTCSKRDTWPRYAARRSALPDTCA